ncbi:MAG: putative toxin-antitoxin system toxin component, PIN family [candidate division KSB1 bacterium]
MIRAVPDVNLYVSAVIRKTGYGGQILARAREFLVFTSEAILADLFRVMHYDHVRRLHKMSDEKIIEHIDLLRSRIRRTPGRLRVEIVHADPDDDIIVACALEAAADYIVSRDHHLLDLKHYHSIQIVSPKAFLEILDREKSLRLN